MDDLVSEFKYVNVRRHLMYLEHFLGTGTRWAVFENNGAGADGRAPSCRRFAERRMGHEKPARQSPVEAHFVRCFRTTLIRNDLRLPALLA